MTAGLDLPRIADRLRAIARMVDRLPPPSHRDPECFHIARSEQAHEIRKVASTLWPDLKATR